VAALIVIAGGGGAAIALSGGGSSETTKKFTVVLHPNDDAAYRARRAKWDEALREIRKQPMGHGLATANQIQQQQGRFVSIGSFNIDNSYLRIGYEQGVVPALLYIAALLTLALGLVRRAIATPDPARAGPALAAAGTLVAYIVVMYPSNAFDGYTALTAWLLAGVGLAPFLVERRAAAVPVPSGGLGDRSPRRAPALGSPRRGAALGRPDVARARVQQVARVLAEEPRRGADVVARGPRGERPAARGLEGVHRALRGVEAHRPARHAHAVADVDVVEVEEVALVEAADRLPRLAACEPEGADGPFHVAAAPDPAALVADPAPEQQVERRRRAPR
jgi:hypothetical protein